MQAEGRKLLIGDILRRAAATVPGRPAVAVGPDQRTFGELDRETERLALALRSGLGIRHGDRVLGWIDTAIEVMPLFIGDGFNDAAMKVIHRARFSPGYKAGHPVKMAHYMPVNFVLEQ